MTFWRSLLSGAILLVSLTGCAAQDYDASARTGSGGTFAAQRPGLAVTDADPALWLLSDDDTKIYLFGTVHYLPPRLGWFDEAVSDAFTASDTLVLELIAPPPRELYSLMLELGHANDGISLRDRLDAETRAQYEAVMAELGQRRAAFDDYEPWFAFMTLYQLLAQETGLDAKQGAEQALSAAAEAQGKTQVGLETAREQLKIFDDLSEQEGLDLLKSIVADPNGVKTQIGQIVQYWTAGDADGLDRYLTETTEDSESERALIGRRNANWVEWIAARMDQPGTVFLAVGAAHLSGPNNVRALLNARGYTIERIDY